MVFQKNAAKNNASLAARWWEALNASCQHSVGKTEALRKEREKGSERSSPCAHRAPCGAALLGTPPPPFRRSYPVHVVWSLPAAMRSLEPLEPAARSPPSSVLHAAGGEAKEWGRGAWVALAYSAPLSHLRHKRNGKRDSAKKINSVQGNGNLIQQKCHKTMPGYCVTLIFLVFM